MFTETHSDEPESFGGALRRARVAAGVTQAELGAPSYSRSYVSLLESGARRPTPDVVTHISAKLGVDRDVVDGWLGAEVSSADLALAALQMEALFRVAQHSRSEAGLLVRDLVSTQIDEDSPLYQGRHLFELLFVEPDVPIPDSLAALNGLMEQRVVRDFPRLFACVLESRCHLLRASGQLEECVETATAGIEQLEQDGDGCEQLLKAYLPLVAALAELGRNEEAVGNIPAMQRGVEVALTPGEEGNGRWALGNLLLMRGDTEAGIAEHERAVELLDPRRYLRPWARLHRAIAAKRLEYGIVTDTVPYYIERAACAFSISSTPSDLLELDAVRASAAVQRGDFAEAAELSRGVIRANADAEDRAGERLSPQQTASVYLTLAESEQGLGRRKEARVEARRAAGLLQSVGAFERALAVCAEWEIAPPRDPA